MKLLATFSSFLVLLIAAQIYAAGLAIFGATSFVPHAITGWSFILLSTVVLLVSLISRRRGKLGLIAAAIWALGIAQPAIVFGLRRWPAAAALHPLVGLVIAALLVAFSRRARLD